MDIERYVTRALDELPRKNIQQIQCETAYTWCGRAIAAAVLGRQDDANEFAHEAIEHAAFCNVPGLLDYVKMVLTRYGFHL